jgi:hypothetical protein
MPAGSRARTSSLLAVAAWLAWAGGAVAGPVAAESAEGSAADDEHYTLRAEVGGEYDSNARRTETVNADGTRPEIVSSLVERAVVSGALSDVIAPGHAVVLGATGAGKLFNESRARQENVAIAQSSGAWQAALGPRARLSLAGSYYEAFQQGTDGPAAPFERRDFRSLAGALQLGMNATDGLTLSANGGYRHLVFKADRAFDFDGPTAGVGLRWLRQPESGADWEVGLGAALEHRRFGGPVRVACMPPAEGVCAGTDRRIDEFVTSQVEVTRTAGVLIGAGYAFHLNDSNSVTESVMRHFVTARFAAALPLGLFLAARADLLFAFYRNGVPIGTVMPTQAGTRFISIEEENRSSIRIDLSRDLGERLRILARYTYYANELGENQGQYGRHTMLLGLAYTVEK